MDLRRDLMNMYNPKRDSKILRSRLGMTKQKLLLISCGVLCLLAVGILLLFFLPSFHPSASVSLPSVTSNATGTEDSTESTAEMTANSQTEASLTTTSVVSTIMNTPTPTIEPTVSNPDNMYSSYANLISFDPETGYAEFDYFDMLRGEDAVNWLVENEGYTKSDAQYEVDHFADGEFVYKNSNPQLRTADMKTVKIRMIYDLSGNMTGPDPSEMSYADFCALYQNHPDVVLHSFFYYVKVDGDTITGVDQTYWS